MHKITFDYLKDIDELNEKLIIYVNQKKIEAYEAWVEPGLHDIKIEQYHIYHNKFFILGVFLAIIYLFGYGVEASYLLRRWGRYAIFSCQIDVDKNELVKVRLPKEKKGILSETYEIRVESEVISQYKSSEKRSVFTILGTLFFFIIPVLLIIGIVMLFN